MQAAAVRAIPLARQTNDSPGGNQMGTALAAAITAVLGVPMIIGLTLWAQRDPQRLPRLTSPGMLIVLVAVLAAAAAVLAQRRGLGAVLVAAPVLVLGSAATLTDVREGRLPNLFTGPLLLLGLMLITADAALAGDPTIAIRGIAGSAIAAAMMGLAKLARPAAVGWGDIKLAGGLGCYLGWVGWHATYAGLFSWWVLIALIAALGLVTGVLRRADQLPYGPAMVLGTLIAVAA